MLQVQCNQCGVKGFTDTGDDPDIIVSCSCCPQDHHHGQAASACPGIVSGEGHPDAACPHPDPTACTVASPEGVMCPGGHCGVGVDGCTVCRPITITVMGGVTVS